MKSHLAAVAVAGLIIGPSAVGRGTSPQVAATQSWFSAVNHKEPDAARADFLPRGRQMDWGSGDTAGWPRFSDVHCRPLSAFASRVDVTCTFRESAASEVGKPDNFWEVVLVLFRKRRLIASHGQG